MRGAAHVGLVDLGELLLRPLQRQEAGREWVSVDWKARPAIRLSGCCSVDSSCFKILVGEFSGRRQSLFDQTVLAGRFGVRTLLVQGTVLAHLKSNESMFGRGPNRTLFSLLCRTWASACSIKQGTSIVQPLSSTGVPLLFCKAASRDSCKVSAGPRAQASAARAPWYLRVC